MERFLPAYLRARQLYGSCRSSRGRGRHGPNNGNCEGCGYRSALDLRDGNSDCIGGGRARRDCNALSELHMIENVRVLTAADADGRRKRDKQGYVDLVRGKHNVCACGAKDLRMKCACSQSVTSGGNILPTLPPCGIYIVGGLVPPCTGSVPRLSTCRCHSST